MKILKNKKALSPVVASIILIAVTVAVSIAVAIWMGALAGGFMGGAEQLNIIDVRFNSTGYKVYIDVSNSGGGTITITDIRIDDISYGAYNATLTVTPQGMDIAKGTTKTFTLAFTNTTWPFQSGVKYYFKFVTAKGNSFMTEKYAPS